MKMWIGVAEEEVDEKREGGPGIETRGIPGAENCQIRLGVTEKKLQQQRK